LPADGEAEVVPPGGAGEAAGLRLRGWRVCGREELHASGDAEVGRHVEVVGAGEATGRDLQRQHAQRGGGQQALLPMGGAAPAAPGQSRPVPQCEVRNPSVLLTHFNPGRMFSTYSK